jgi:hypothetical protein
MMSRSRFALLAMILVAGSALAAPPAEKAQRAAAADVQSAEPAVAAPAGAATAPRAPKPAAGVRKGGGALDRLELETTQITGNRELPKVMVIVPWKRSDIGDLAGRPSNSLVDEALRPVDRDVFRREVAYYEALSASSARSETPVTAPKRDGGAEK